MHGTKMISAWQFFSLMFISRMILFLTNSPQLSGREDTLFTLLANTVYFLVALILLFPLYLLFKDHRDLNILQLGDYAFGALGKGIAILIGLYVVFEAGIELAQYNLFISTAVMTEESVILLSVCLMFCAVLAVYMGVQGLARAAGIFLVLMVVAILFIFLALTPEFRLTNVEPLINQGAGTFADTILATLSQNVEFVALALMIPLVKGKLKKGAVWWTVGQIVCYLLIMIPVLFALGQYGKTQEYPFFAAAKLAEWGIFQRLDALHLALWIAAMFIKMSTLLYLFTVCVSHLFSEKIAKYSLIAATVAVGAVGVLLTRYERVFLALYSGTILLPISIFFSFALPLLIWLAAKIRKKREERRA